MKPEYNQKCVVCGKELFYSSIDSLGHCKKNSRCRKCANIYKRTLVKKLNHSWKGYEDISLSYFNEIEGRSIKKGNEFTITIEDIWKLYINQNKKCIYTGIDLILPSRSRISRKGNASLDRIDSSKGYIVGNIQWVHKDINWMKQDFDHHYFVDMCNKVSTKYNTTDINTPIDIFIKNNKQSSTI